MKKILSFITVAALLLPATVSAQEKRGWAAGIKGGLVYGAVTGKSVCTYMNSDYEMSTYDMAKGGFKNIPYFSGLAAVYSDYRFNDSWALGSEIGLAVVKEPRDSKDEFGSWFVYKDHNRPQLYIAPATVKYYIPKAGGLHITLGPELGINIGSRYFKLYRGVGGDVAYRLKYNPVTFAINSGIGYRFNFGMVLQAEYSAGLTRTVSKTGGYPNIETDYRDGMFRFSLSYDLFKRRK